MMSSVKRVCLDYNYRVLHFFGLWQNCEPKGTQSIGYYWRKFMVPFQLFRFLFVLLFHLIALDTLWSETQHRVHESVVILGVISTIIKLCTISFQKESIAKCFKTFEDLSGPDSYVDEHCEDIRRAADRFCEKFGKCTIGFFTVVPLLEPTFLYRQTRDTYALVAGRYHPLGSTLNPLIEWATIGLVLVSTFDMVIVAVVDNTYLAITAHAIAQFRILRYKIENLRELAIKMKPDLLEQPQEEPVGSQKGQTRREQSFIYISLKGQERDVISVKPTKQIDDEEDSLLDILAAESEHDVSDQGKELESDMEGERFTDLHPEMEKLLHECVKHHEILLQICNELQRVFKPTFACQMVLTVVLSLLGLHIKMLLRKGTFAGDVFPEIGLMLAGIFEYFCLCLSADKLTQASAEIYNAAYACDWLEASEGFKGSLRIILSRTLKPVVLTGAGVPLSMPSFKKVVKAAHYFNSMITNIVDGEKILKYRNE